MRHINKAGKRQITIEINKSHDVVAIGFNRNGWQTTIVDLDKELLTMLVESLAECGPQLEEWINMRY